MIEFQKAQRVDFFNYKKGKERDAQVLRWKTYENLKNICCSLDRALNCCAHCDRLFLTVLEFRFVLNRTVNLAYI